jgi:hypothetical protein
MCGPVFCYHDRHHLQRPDPYGSVAPVGVCRLFPSIAVPDQILHDNTRQG